MRTTIDQIVSNKFLMTAIGLNTRSKKTKLFTRDHALELFGTDIIGAPNLVIIHISYHDIQYI